MRGRVLVALAMAVVGFAACGGQAHPSAGTPKPAPSTTAATGPTSAPGAKTRIADRAVESDLRNALTAEKTLYTDTQEYSASVTTMKSIEPTLDWGGRLHIVVGDARGRGDGNVVCLTESSPSGTTLAIADVASGPHAGTYYGPHACPAPPITATSVSTLGESFSSDS